MDAYKKSGYTEAAVGSIVTLIVGVGVGVLVLIFVGTLGGQTYNLAQSDIGNISDATIQAHVKNAISSGFQALENTGKYMPLIVLAVVISLVMVLVLGMTRISGAGGSAL